MHETTNATFTGPIELHPPTKTFQDEAERSNEVYVCIYLWKHRQM